METDDGLRDREWRQEMALLKPAGGGREKPWHQDAAYFNIGEVTTPAPIP